MQHDPGPQRLRAQPNRCTEDPDRNAAVAWMTARLRPPARNTFSTCICIAPRGATTDAAAPVMPTMPVAIWASAAFTMREASGLPSPRSRETARGLRLLQRPHEDGIHIRAEAETVVGAQSEDGGPGAGTVTSVHDADFEMPQVLQLLLDDLHLQALGSIRTQRPPEAEQARLRIAGDGDAVGLVVPQHLDLAAQRLEEEAPGSSHSRHPARSVLIPNR
jgi:hypothetical protein